MDSVKSMICIQALVMLMVVPMSHCIDGAWDDARATFYGDIQGGETLQGACGYDHMFGLDTTALSSALFNNGSTCGACYEIICVNSPQWCIPGAGTIRVTATNLCPPNPTGGWCNPPQRHFDLTKKMFLRIAEERAGVIPVRYRRVPCARAGGVKFLIKGNPNFIMVLLYNVGGAGDVNGVQIKGSGTGWLTMRRNWGQNWQTGMKLTGQSLSFKVTVSDGRTMEFDNVAPANWGFGQTFQGRANF